MASIERIHKAAPLDLAKLEKDVVASLPATRVAPSGAMPDYVEHQEGVTRVGALTAEAVVRDYEAAAKEIEAMGAELISAAQKCEAMTAEVHSAIGAFARSSNSTPRLAQLAQKRSRCGAGLRRDRPLVRPSEGKSS